MTPVAPEGDARRMSSQQPTALDRVIRELERSFMGPTWHGPTLYELVSALPSARANARPLAAAHTIAELTGHARVWKEAVRRRLAGEPWSPGSEAENFPPVPGEDAWQSCLLALRQEHERLVDAVRLETAATLDRAMPAGDGSAFDQILGVIQHDLYHAGQVALLLKQID